ncbi:MAG TPA: hypothetical protein PKN24_10415 [bacterium]|nr:hypothetical protein [bacterium]
MNDIFFWFMLLVVGGFFVGLIVFAFYIFMANKGEDPEAKKYQQNHKRNR